MGSDSLRRGEFLGLPFTEFLEVLTYPCKNTLNPCFLRELGKYIDNKRYLIIGFVGGSQLVLFLTFKFYFFKRIY